MLYPTTLLSGIEFGSSTLTDVYYLVFSISLELLLPLHALAYRAICLACLLPNVLVIRTWSPYWAFHS